MKKLVSLLLGLVLVVGCCTFAQADGPVTVRVWHPRGAGANGEMIAAQVEEFNKTIGAEKGIVTQLINNEIPTFIINHKITIDHITYSYFKQLVP